MTEVGKEDSNDIMKKPDNFAKLNCRYIISGTLTNISQLHVGAGTAETEFSIIDNPLIRLKIENDEIPYIPGSSLKGVIRTEVERFLKALEEKKGPTFEKICYPYDNRSKCNTGNIERICLACRIFGNTQVGSHFIVSDSILKMSNFPGVKIKPGIAINRITGSTQRGALYEIETLQPGGIFDFEFQIININLKANNDIARAIKFVLGELLRGWIQVGGKRSTGLGQIKIIDAKVTEIRPEHLETLKFDEYDLKQLLGE